MNNAMCRPLRRHAPDTYYLVTARCHQARFFLRPDSALNESVLEWLARTQQRYPDVHIHAVCVMSNHLHILLHDTCGELASWASHFFGNLARSVNRVRERRGVVFERRYAAEPVLDDVALLDRLVYVVTNPAAAGLCERTRQWPGVALWAAGEQPEQREVSWIDRGRYRRARHRAKKRGQAPPDPEGFRISSTLVLCSLGAYRVGEAIEARERELAAEREGSGRPAMTRDEVLAQDWHAAPRRAKRSPRPICHTSDRTLRQAFLRGFREFVEVFRQGSAKWRAGCLDAVFPPWSYPPSCPLVRFADARPG
jgi:REP element-mobilizing transposase RayT